MKRNNSYISRIVLSLGLLWVAVSLSSANAADNAAENRIFVKGQVLSQATGSPVFGASVKAGKTSVFTNEEGRFELVIQTINDVLVVTEENFIAREYPLRGRQDVVIELYPKMFGESYKSIELPGGKVKNSQMVSAAKTVDLGLNQAVSVDELFQSSLGGDIRSVSRSGLPGIGSLVFIRGLNSLNAKAQPLLVVDGVIWNDIADVQSIFEGFQSNILMNIDVNDIESVTVLKDGTALYGSKAANGVINIKTKRGQSPVTKIDLRIMAGMVTEPGKLPMMNADQYRVYASELLQTVNQSTLQTPQFLDFLVENPANPIYNTYHNVTEWNDEVYQRGITQGYNISVNGGDQKALYHFSLGYTGNKGIVQTTSMERISSRFNADINVVDNLSIGMNVGFANINRGMMDDGVNLYTSPTYMAYVKSPFLSPYSFTSLGYKAKDYADADLFGIGNPSSFIQGSQNNYKEYRFNIGFMPVYTINKHWSLSTLFDYNLNKFLEDYFSPMHGSYPRELEGYGMSENTVKNQLIRTTSVFDDTRLNYRLNKKSFDLKALLGWRYMTNYLEADYIEAHNSGTDNNTTVGNYDFLQTDGLNNRTKTVSTYANVDFNYLNRYFVNAALSVDGSSRFGKETKGGFQLFGHSFALFPGLNAAWLISSESFMKNVRFFDYLKLRAGFDVTGNDGIQDYATKAYFVTRRYMDQANGVILSNLANEELQWETTSRLHAGLDMALLNERLLLNVDVYDATTDDLLTLRSLNQIAGVDYYWSNEGKLSNRGFEVSAEAKLVNTKNFQWSLAASIGHYRNLIEELPEGRYINNAYGAEILTEVGQAAGVFWGYKTKGVYSSEAEALANPMAIVNDNGSLTYFKAGDVIFEDFEQDGILDEKDKQIIGDPNPDFYGNISTKFSYKKWTLNTLFTYSYGNEVYNYLRSQLESGKDFGNQTKAMLLRWTADGQNATQPRSVYGDPMANSRFSDRWIEDGSFLRLKSVSLSYAIPIDNEFIKGLEFSLSANNLFLFTNYLGLDPESSVSDKVLFQGIDNGLIPQTQCYFLGLRVNL